METEEIHKGEENLTESLNTLLPLWPAHPIVTIDCLNHLGILWNNRANYAKVGFSYEANSYPSQAEEFLKKAEELYLQQNFTTDGMDSASLAKIEGLHTMTLFYLAQMYGYNKNSVKVRSTCLLTSLTLLQSAIYCRKTLQRQLQAGDFNPEV